MFRRVVNWCEVCRDSNPELKCQGTNCKKKYHIECLSLANLVYDGINLENFLCLDCQEDKDNDEICFICNNNKDYDVLLMCDGCNQSGHLECLGYNEPPTHDYWFCNACDPDQTQKTETKKSTVMVAGAAGKNKIGNVEICYICQKDGKLLGCDSCEQSFHPSCLLPEYLEFDMDSDWNCPLCRGDDPLKDMMHKRMSKSERIKLSRQRQKCIQLQSKKCRYNRDLFLYSQLKCLTPFISKKTALRLEKAAIEAGIKKNANDDLEQIDEESSQLFFKECEKLADDAGFSLLKSGINLKWYQYIGVYWLYQAYIHKAGAILADEMGLGKTIQALTFLSCLQSQGITGPHLIIVPLSTVGNWAREIRNFVPHFTFIKLCGSKAERDHTISDDVAYDGLYDIYITTYETIITEEAFFADKFSWQTVILDEAHRIKNESGRIRHSLDRIDSNMRVLLTGTPLQNNIRELFTLLNFLFPDILQDSAEFELAFQIGNVAKANNNKKNNEQLDHTSLLIDNTKVKAVNALLSNLLLRRTKDKVVNLPPKLIFDIWLPLSPTAVVWYDRLIKSSQVDFNNLSVRKLFGTVVKMRLTCCHPSSLVSKQNQYTKMTTFFNEYLKESADSLSETSNDIMRDADEQKLKTGYNHLISSNKLLFLDKLLTQLHEENMNYSSTYETSYINRRINYIRDIYKPKEEEQENDENMKLLDQIAECLDEEEIKKLSLELMKKLNYDCSRTSKDIFTDGLLSAQEDSLEKKHIRLHQKLNNKKVDITDDYKTPDITDVFVDINTNTIKKTDDIRTHKILIFTQFQLVLDELEKYCIWRGWSYMRLDGSTNKLIRELDIREFNSSNSTHFIYLICTRAGGLGINLVAANHVVMYDEDWNPFIDMQAVDRVHRIGQKRDVHVWKLMTEWTVEERMAFRREQKLKLDKAVIQAHVEALQIDSSNSSDDNKIHGLDSDEKLQPEEIRKLFSHGKEAISNLRYNIIDRNLNDLINCGLEVLINRERKPLPTQKEIKEDEEEEEEEEEEEGEMEGENVIEIQTCIDEEEDDKMKKVDTTSSLADSEPNNDSMVLCRTKRIRRKPQTLYQPQMWLDKEKSSVRMTHERNCFSCMGDTKGQENEIICCARCPKVYHMSKCLNMIDSPKRSWICPWHECCLCFRRASQAGGILIHCAECPTAFCSDCFPPDYFRHTPASDYFQNLEKNGCKLDPKKFLLFLCSRCKAMKQQQRRRLLSKQQIEQELKEQKERIAKTKEELRLKKVSDGKRENKKKAETLFRREAADKKKNFVDDMKDREKRVRQVYFDFFPTKFINIIEDFRQNLVNQKLETNKKKEQLSSNNKEEEEINEDNKVNDVKSKSIKQETMAQCLARLPLHAKYPSELIRLCDNCKLPYHEVTECPFPQELLRIQVPVGVQSITFDTEGKPVVVEPKKTEKIENKDNDDEVIIIENNDKEEEKIKNQFRGFCPLCGTSSRLHSRYLCSLLEEEDSNEYIIRNDKIKNFIQMAENIAQQLKEGETEIKEDIKEEEGKTVTPSNLDESSDQQAIEIIDSCDEKQEEKKLVISESRYKAAVDSLKSLEKLRKEITKWVNYKLQLIMKENDLSNCITHMITYKVNKRIKKENVQQFETEEEIDISTTLVDAIKQKKRNKTQKTEIIIEEKKKKEKQKTKSVKQKKTELNDDDENNRRPPKKKAKSIQDSSYFPQNFAFPPYHSGFSQMPPLTNYFYPNASRMMMGNYYHMRPEMYFMHQNTNYQQIQPNIAQRSVPDAFKQISNNAKKPITEQSFLEG